jgi:hypothetical protein
VPTDWLPDGAKSVAGRTIKGVEVKRTASAMTGTLAIDGLTVAVDTTQPLVWSATGCTQPTGQVRLQVKATVLVTFSPGPNCAPPTWTRDGVAMGPLVVNWPAWAASCK